MAGSAGTYQHRDRPRASDARVQPPRSSGCVPPESEYVLGAVAERPVRPDTTARSPQQIGREKRPPPRCYHAFVDSTKAVEGIIFSLDFQNLIRVRRDQSAMSPFVGTRVRQRRSGPSRSRRSRFSGSLPDLIELSLGNRDGCCRILWSIHDGAYHPLYGSLAALSWLCFEL